MNGGGGACAIKIGSIDASSSIDVPIRRLDCYPCGARAAERLSWLDAGERITHRLRAWVGALVQILPIAHIAELTGLH